MADFSLPTLTTGYAEFLAQMKQRDEDIIKMLDGTTSLNLPSGAKRWNTTANKWEKYDGTSWSDLSTSYEIKVADSNKLNGQVASYYATASHTHTGYAATNHTHSEYAATGHNHNMAYLGKTAQASDSAKLAGFDASISSEVNTIGLRDGGGDLYARLFRSSYGEQTTPPTVDADICFRNDTANDNYMRFMSSVAFKSWLTNIGVAVTDTNTWRDITDSVTTTSSAISASATAVKAAYALANTAFNEPFVVGNYCEAATGPSQWVETETPIKKHEYKVKRSGILTVVFTITQRMGGEYNVSPRGQIYINNVARGTLRAPAAASGTYTENIAVNKDDLLQIYVWGSSTYNDVQISSSGLFCNNPTVTSTIVL